ncbi:acyl-CoA dehydratase activase-related protein [Acidaminobacterium chupaoyuni]
MKIGIDVGSTTIKCVVLDDHNAILYQSYERHLSQITEKTTELLQTILKKYPQPHATLAITGSAGMGMALGTKIPFIQEVYATRLAASSYLPGTDVIIELGGEDAKILFLTGGTEVRMNGTCAGGTGAFIDQMSTLMHLTPDEMNQAASAGTQVYTIASRCGVFAKSDIQPLLNQGAQKTDVALSIFYAVVNQTIAGLAQGRPIKGNVVYLGGPLTFFSQLRTCFDTTLKTTGICPPNSLYYAALGAALSAQDEISLDDALARLRDYHSQEQYASIDPLFASREEYEAFHKRHSANTVPSCDPAEYNGDAFLGIDSGSTTVKVVAITPEGAILCSLYTPNNGDPTTIVKNFLMELYEKYPKIHIARSAVTGYGEGLIQNAFSVDEGIVETVAHFTAAKKFMPNVEFIIDIGGQDIKCFKIRNGVIDNIFLNEACSSGCGSFLQTFAGALGYPMEEFAKLGLFADKPVDLGSRCTVFMNSSVKQAQKDGASIENISAGLSISVVKNALYKVIRATSAAELGQHIVVQGGTFLNDAVLRAFEQELHTEVIRPGVAGLMGAYGAALYAAHKAHGSRQSTLLSLDELKQMKHEVRTVNCGLCSNNCKLTINSFGGDRRYISGNRCERPITKRASDVSLDIYAYKQELLGTYQPQSGPRGKIGIPMGLNLYELLPFWHSFFTSLGFEVHTSPASTRQLYLNGQSSIPSDTVCYPAKLMHGHVQALIDEGCETIFYPCMSYNLNEEKGDNHYNCPVVAYYPEVIAGNLPHERQVRLITDYIGLHRPHDFPRHMQAILAKYFPEIPLAEIRKASKTAMEAYRDYFQKIRRKGSEIIETARARSMPIVVLAGRPYHVDPEINHGIDKLVCAQNAAVISEDCISQMVPRFATGVLNQWTYHARLYSAARYIVSQPDMQLVQLVSFGCGLDAITTDEVREILEQGGKIYTQIKIDEITNLGAVKIRLRSLFAAVEALKGESSNG